MGFKRERTQRRSNVYLSSYCNRGPHNEKVPIQKDRCKRIFKIESKTSLPGSGSQDLAAKMW